MDNSSQHFGLIVAYLLPGFLALAGVALIVPAVAQWLQPALQPGSSGIGPPVYAVLAATAAGMILSCFRWLVVDHLHAAMGLKQPAWDVDRLESRLRTFNSLVEFHYRYYQFYANTLIAILWTYSLYRWLGTSAYLGIGTDAGVFVLCVILFAGSRDALAKYYARTQQLIGLVADQENTGGSMTNGCHHDQPTGTATSKRQPAKPQQKKVESTKPQPPKGAAANTPK